MEFLYDYALQQLYKNDNHANILYKMALDDVKQNKDLKLAGFQIH